MYREACLTSCTRALCDYRHASGFRGAGAPDTGAAVRCPGDRGRRQPDAARGGKADHRKRRRGYHIWYRAQSLRASPFDRCSLSRQIYAACEIAIMSPYQVSNPVRDF